MLCTILIYSKIIKILHELSSSPALYYSFQVCGSNSLLQCNVFKNLCIKHLLRPLKIFSNLDAGGFQIVVCSWSKEGESDVCLDEALARTGQKKGGAALYA